MTPQQFLTSFEEQLSEFPKDDYPKLYAMIMRAARNAVESIQS